MNEVALQMELLTKVRCHGALAFCAISGTRLGYAASHTAEVFHGTRSKYCSAPVQPLPTTCASWHPAAMWLPMNV